MYIPISSLVHLSDAGGKLFDDAKEQRVQIRDTDFFLDKQSFISEKESRRRRDLFH